MRAGEGGRRGARRVVSRQRAARASLAFALLAFFVAAVRPATLFAEAAPAPPQCTDPVLASCAEVDAGAACTVNGDPGTCGPSLCLEDAGTSRSALRCYANPKPATCGAPERVAACVGKAPGDACEGGTACVEIRCQGVAEPALVCGTFGSDGGPGGSSGGAGGGTSGPGGDASGQTSGDGTGSGAEADADDPAAASEGCQTGRGGSPAGGLGAGAALGVGVALALRARRRRAP